MLQSEARITVARPLQVLQIQRCAAGIVPPVPPRYPRPFGVSAFLLGGRTSSRGHVAGTARWSPLDFPESAQRCPKAAEFHSRRSHTREVGLHAPAGDGESKSAPSIPTFRDPEVSAALTAFTVSLSRSRSLSGSEVAQSESRTRVIGRRASLVAAFCGDLCALPLGRASRPTPRFSTRAEKDLSPFGGRGEGGVRRRKERLQIPPLGLSDRRTFLHLIGSRRAKITQQTRLLLAA